LIAVVGAEQEKVSKEKAFANEEQKKVAVIAEDVGQKQKVCSIELAKAEPALIAAKAALDTLNKVRTSLISVTVHGAIEIALKFSHGFSLQKRKELSRWNLMWSA